MLHFLRCLTQIIVKSGTVRLAVGNTAVIGSLCKLMSPEDAWPLTDEAEHLRREGGWHLELLYVGSEENLAYSATHNEVMEAYRTEVTWSVLNQ